MDLYIFTTCIILDESHKHNAHWRNKLKARWFHLCAVQTYGQIKRVLFGLCRNVINYKESGKHKIRYSGSWEDRRRGECSWIVSRDRPQRSWWVLFLQLGGRRRVHLYMIYMYIHYIHITYSQWMEYFIIQIVFLNDSSGCWMAGL